MTAGGVLSYLERSVIATRHLRNCIKPHIQRERAQQQALANMQQQAANQANKSNYKPLYRSMYTTLSASYSSSSTSPLTLHECLSLIATQPQPEPKQRRRVEPIDYAKHFN